MDKDVMREAATLASEAATTMIGHIQAIINQLPAEPDKEGYSLRVMLTKIAAQSQDQLATWIPKRVNSFLESIDG